MKKIETKNINKVMLVTIIVCLLTVIIGVGFIYTPFRNKTKSLRSQILSERDRNLVAGKINALSKHIMLYKKRLPESGRNVSWLLGKVSDIATKEVIEISSIRPATSEERDLYTKLYVIVDTISNYHDLGRFLSKVESSGKFLKVESIDMKRLSLDKEFVEESSSFKTFDVKANIIISAVVFKE